MNDCNCNKCDKRCKDPCGCAEPVFSVEALSDDPTVLRFNVNGKSVWYDFSFLVKNAETCTTLNADAIARTLNYIGECGENTLTAKELGAIFHLSDLGDIDELSIKDNGILNYQVTTTCPEGCEGSSNKWVSTNPVDVAETSLSYVLGSDGDGKLSSLMPPADTSTFSYLAWAAQNKVKWVKPTVVSTPPVKDGKIAQLYLDENTGEIVVVRSNAQ